MIQRKTKNKNPPFIKGRWRDYKKKDRKITSISILLLLFLAVLMMIRQLASTGYFSCHMEDTLAYTSWAWQFVEALKEGIIYPRWAYLSYWGYGSPAFIVYSPLAYYLVAFFEMFTGSVIEAMNITKFVALFLSGVGMFYLVRELYAEKIALLTASFYIVFPYTIFQFYLVGTFYSTISIVWFPPLILFTYRYMRDRQYKDVIYAGLCYGGLILTHLINAYMFTFIFVAFILYMSVVQKRLKDTMIIPLIIIVGFLISSAYTLPVIFEKQFVHLKVFIGEGGDSGFINDFHNFFILPNMTRKFTSGHLWHAFYDTFVFYVSLFCVLIILSFLQILKLRKIEKMKDINSVNIFFLGAALFTIFLLFGISTFIWEIVPFFKYIQFSHRWLNITTFTAVFLVSATFCVIGNIYKTKKERTVLLIVLFLICIISFLLDYKYIRLAPAINEQELIPIKPPHWYKIDLPASVDIDAIDKNDKSTERVVIMRGEGEVVLSKWKSAERVIEITAYEPLIVRIRTFNFPGWKAYIDKKQTEIRTEEDVGAMLIDIPKGRHDLVIRFEDTPVRYYAKLLSLISLFSVFVLVLFSKKLGRSKPR